MQAGFYRLSLFGIRHCATSPSGCSAVLATRIDQAISIYDAWSPTMLTLQPRGDSIYGADICTYDA